LKANFPRKTLLDAILTVSSVAPSRSPKPILQNVKMTVDGDRVSIQATDLEVAIQRTIGDAFVVDDGDVILPTDRFTQILRTSNAAEISLETVGDKLHIKAGGSRFSLPNEDPALFPVASDFDFGSYMILLGADLKRLIKRTAFATDVDSTRYALGGVFVERDADSVGFVATDGRRLAKATTKAEWFGEADGSAQCILPCKALKLLDKAISDDGDQVHFGVSAGTTAMFRTSDSVISTRLVEGRFPRYSDVFPKESGVTIPLDVASFRSAIEQAAIVASEESRGVAFKFSAEGCELSCQSSDAGESRVELPLLCSMGEAIEVVMDPRYVTESLRTLEPTTPLTVDLIDSRNPVVFKTEDGYTYVVMPLTKS
jgi:DNA polymerase-3 subunit beta